MLFTLYIHILFLFFFFGGGGGVWFALRPLRLFVLCLCLSVTACVCLSVCVSMCMCTCLEFCQWERAYFSLILKELAYDQIKCILQLW